MPTSKKNAPVTAQEVTLTAQHLIIDTSLKHPDPLKPNKNRQVTPSETAKQNRSSFFRKQQAEEIQKRNSFGKRSKRSGRNSVKYR